MTQRDLDKAWSIFEHAIRDPTRGERQAVVEEIAHLLAEIRKLRKAK